MSKSHDKRIEKLENSKTDPEDKLDYSLLSDKELDRCLELLKGTEYEFLSESEQAELDEIAKKIAVA
jgi:hypothetical protein